jgi:foldase protein PrsA
MKTRNSILALGAFFVAVAIAVAGCGSGMPGNAVASVAGNPISTQAFNHWMFVVAKGQAASSPGQPVIVPNDPPNFSKCIAQVRAQIPSLEKISDKQLETDCNRLFTSLSSQVMGFLITTYWYQADAHKLGIKETTAEVNAALAKAKKGQFSTAAQFNTYLKSTGQTLDDVLFRVRRSEIVSKLSKRRPTTVTQAAIAGYYASHKSQFGTPASRNMRIVLAKTQAQAQAAKTALSHGQSWTTVAKKYSTDPTTKNNGGLLTNVTAGQQDAALSQAALAAPLNKVIGPVKGQFGYYIVQVIKVTAATQQTLAQATAQIKTTLATQLTNTAQTAVSNHAKADWLSKTTCRSLYAMADCSGYKAPKTSSTAAAQSTPPASAGATSTAAAPTTTAAP